MSPKITALIETRVRRYGYTLAGHPAEDKEMDQLRTSAMDQFRDELTDFAEQVQRIVWEEGNQVGDELPVVS